MNISDEKYVWREDQEHLLKKWADHALCYKLLHERAYKKYWCFNAWIQIPIIIISTLTGTGNFASASISNDNNYLIFTLGALNIIAGILATITNYLGIAQKLEIHKIITISWEKFNRKIEIELIKIRADRKNPNDYISHISDEYNKLIDMSPIISNDILRWFIKIIDSGYIDDNFDDSILCIYDCMCFPFGCYICNCLKCCCSKNRKKINKFNNLHDLDLPEILGYIKPIVIAKENNLNQELKLTIQNTSDSIIENTSDSIIENTVDSIIENTSNLIIENTSNLIIGNTSNSIIENTSDSEINFTY